MNSVTQSGATIVLRCLPKMGLGAEKIGVMWHRFGFGGSVSQGNNKPLIEIGKIPCFRLSNALFVEAFCIGCAVILIGGEGVGTCAQGVGVKPIRAGEIYSQWPCSPLPRCSRRDVEISRRKKEGRPPRRPCPSAHKPDEGFDGLTVKDMPGGDPTTRQMNFSLFKRGKISKEYIVKNATEKRNGNFLSASKRVAILRKQKKEAELRA